MFNKNENKLNKNIQILFNIQNINTIKFDFFLYAERF
jgi:hypothetical protein